MDEKRLLDALKQIRSLADAALSGTVSKAKIARASQAEAKGNPESLPNQIVALRDQGFLSQPKTYNEVHQELSPTYPCEVDRVKVACKRLQHRKLLRKTSKTIGKKKQIAYVW